MTHFDESNPYGDIAHYDEEIENMEDEIEEPTEKKFSIGSVSRIFQDKKEKQWAIIPIVLVAGLIGFFYLRDKRNL